MFRNGFEDVEKLCERMSSLAELFCLVIVEVIHHWNTGVSENRLNPYSPNGFADHYPYEKWLFHWEY